MVIDGLLLIDKPAGCTSHDVVSRCRGIFRQKRIGHAGTLDPDATGVLVLALGRATRLLQFLSGLPKTYSTEIVLGAATTTLDAAGEVTGRWDMSGVTVEQARAAAAGFVGDILQVPPMVSAIKIGGRRLHELARQGVEVDRPPRPVSVYRFDIAAGDRPGVMRAEVDCSSGTYVRSLVADLGTALGGGAHLRSLRRLAVGPFVVGQCLALEAVSAMEQPHEVVLPPLAALPGMGRVKADDVLAQAAAHGKVVTIDLLGDGPGPWALVGSSEELLAVYEAHRPGTAKPTVVLAPAAP
ncbi:MAG TPA: tRNA pseudouridine(55) synthase TruB [Acidimicrobiales bacterium]|nr:tRNA pseudouridine(55) synthase TruB [Acidimicrobiales bacterium]